jgi:hypothetical protein
MKQIKKSGPTDLKGSIQQAASQRLSGPAGLDYVIHEVAC